MGSQTTFHAPGNGADFLGWRISRGGQHEIVYEDGSAHRLVWRVASDLADEVELAAALEMAVKAPRVVASLQEELKKRSIAVESIIV